MTSSGGIQRRNVTVIGTLASKTTTTLTMTVGTVL